MWLLSIARFVVLNIFLKSMFELFCRFYFQLDNTYFLPLLGKLEILAFYLLVTFNL